jgi:hypothetical protein
MKAKKLSKVRLFRVKISFRPFVKIVEADNEDDAEEKARKILTNDFSYYVEEDNCVEVDEV